MDQVKISSAINLNKYYPLVLGNISAGTRSEDGRRCRDTFASLKKTCRKQGVSFWEYLKDRVAGLNVIPSLAELIRRPATA